MTPPGDPVLPGLRTRCFGRHLRHRRQVDSTNAELWRWSETGAGEGSVCLADAQTAGRGRQGRRWSSAPGAGLYASLLLAPPLPLAKTLAFSPLTALVVAETLEELAGIEVRVKWPNDVLLHGRKLGGILLESRAGATPRVVVGIGVNLVAPHGGWPPALASRAIALSEADARVSAPSLLAAVLNRLEPVYDGFLLEGFGGHMDAWQARSTLRGRFVRAMAGEFPMEGLVLGIDEHGRLRIRREGGDEVLLEAGEVHLLEEETP